MKKNSIFIKFAIIIEIIFLFIKYVSYNSAVLKIVDYHILGSLLIILSLLFYFVGIAYLVHIVKNFQSVYTSDLLKVSQEFLVLAIFDFLTYFNFKIFVIDSVCCRLVMIVFLINLIAGIMKKCHKKQYIQE